MLGEFMNKTVYFKWYNLARTIINDDFLIPVRSDNDTVSFVSREGWLGFAPKGISMKQLETSDMPNIFFEIYDDGTAIIGLTYNNVGAVNKAKNILTGFHNAEREELLKKLSKLAPFWRLIVYRKVKEHHQSQHATYEDVLNEQSNKIDDKLIEDVINRSQEIREIGQKNPINAANYPRETPAITLMESKNFELTEKAFSERVTAAFDVLRTCLKVKSDSQINQAKKAKQKDIDKEIEQKRNELHSIESTIKSYDWDMNRSGRKHPLYGTKVVEMERKKKEIQELEKALL